MLVRSISGLRATLGDDLTPAVVTAYTAGFAQFCPEGRIVVGRDGRRGGEAIEQVVVGTLLAAGRSVERLGVVPTPSVQLACEAEGRAGGISITASHNPAEWNGLKFLGEDGLFLGPSEVADLFTLVDAEDFAWSGHSEQGSLVDRTDFAADHIAQTLALPLLDRDAIAERSLRIVVDAVNASGSRIVPQLLEELGCTVIPLSCDSSGVFPHAPEPIPENLGDLCHAVVQQKADLGIAVDPDADRLVLIDETGHPIGEEYTITIAADYALAHALSIGDRCPFRRIVAVNLSTTRAVDDVAARHDASVVRTPVGEINVVEGLKEAKGMIGGEGSGGVILPALHYGRDALAGIALTLSALAQAGGSLSELRASMPHYVIVKKKLPLATRADALPTIERVAAAYEAEGRIDRADGLRVDFARPWFHIRASNTEPILQIIAEAPTAEEAEALVNRVPGDLGNVG